MAPPRTHSHRQRVLVPRTRGRLTKAVRWELRMVDEDKFGEETGLEGRPVQVSTSADAKAEGTKEEACFRNGSYTGDAQEG